MRLLLLLLLPVMALAQGREITMAEAQGKKVKDIRFVHLRDKPFRNPDLRAAMQTREGEPFQRRFFRADLSAIEVLYWGEGYQEVAIPGRILILEDERDLHLILRIDSKTRWLVSDVKLEPASPCDTTALRQQLQLAPGGVYRYSQLVQDEHQLQTFLNSRGYSRAQVEKDVHQDPTTHRAEVIYRVDPGKKMYFGEVYIVPGDTLRPLRTRLSLIQRQLSFHPGELYDPAQLTHTSASLTRMDLFRGVSVTPLIVTADDSLQPVEVRLLEKRYLHLESNAFLNIAGRRVEPGLSANLQHRNWLGRGTRLGLDAGLGRPLQGGTVYLSERNLFKSGVDLTLSSGLTDEWGRTTEVYADPNDSLQVALLTANDSILNGLLLFAGPEAVSQFIAASKYRYASVQRVWQYTSTLGKTWEKEPAGQYQTDFSVAWNQARTQPELHRNIEYNAFEPDSSATVADSTDTSLGGDPFGGEDPFGGGDPFGNDDPFGGNPGGTPSAPVVDYSDGKIPVDQTWQLLLTDRSNTLNFTLHFQRDTRNDPIAASRGTFLRASTLYAIQIGGQNTRVFDGDLEARLYLPLGRNLIWAQSLRGGLTASLRKERALPQLYWKEYGGEGSVRGVGLNSIQATGGGRVGLNLRSELRVTVRDFGLVFFWDRAGVWRHTGQTNWSGMVDGYGTGLRYTLGIPFRLDFGWSGGLAAQPVIYFSIGQAF